jgi:hypothetical protein
MATTSAHTCPVCGTQHEDTNFLNVTAIQSATAWVRIELTDDEISALARGTHRIVVTPKEGLTMTKHTPGPWQLHGAPGDDAWDVVSSSGESVAEIAVPHGKVSERTKANATLIAAAPQMLEALRPFAEALAEGEKVSGDTLARLKEALMHISYRELCNARAAIAEAEASS